MEANAGPLNNRAKRRASPLHADFSLANFLRAGQWDRRSRNTGAIEATSSAAIVRLNGRATRGSPSARRIALLGDRVGRNLMRSHSGPKP